MATVFFFVFFVNPQKQKVESSTEKGSGPLPRNDKCLCRVSQYCMYGQLYREKAFLVSAGLKQQNGHLTQVEVDEMLGLMSHVAAKVPPNDAVPGRVIFLVKLLFDVCSDVFLDVILLQGLCGTLHGVLLHVLRHVSIFDHCLSVRHGCLVSVYCSSSFKETTAPVVTTPAKWLTQN